MSSLPQAWSISSLNNMAKELLEANIPNVLVEGEISNFLKASSGHLYFSLKDKHAQIRAVLFKTQAMSLRIKPADGMLVRASARLSLYTPRGDMQLIIQHMDKAGAGELQAAFLRLKERLHNEGLFAQKRPLPLLCTHLAVITSTQGAVLHDVIQILRRRYPSLPISVIPSSVQGDRAAPELVEAFQRLSRLPDIDVVLICRGGGSIEDLWAFNDEALARSIYACPIPVISAVGHETDFTICDFVADLRAATPSAAAELISEPALRLSQHVESCHHRLNRSIRQNIPDPQWLDQQQIRLNQSMLQQHQRFQDRINVLQQRLRQPTQHQLWRQQLLNHRKNLAQSAQFRIKHLSQQVHHVQQRLEQQDPRQQLKTLQERFDGLQQRLLQLVSTILSKPIEQLGFLAHRAHTSSPLSTMNRGYSLLFKETLLIKNIAMIAPQDIIQARLIDGSAELTVIRITSLNSGE